MSASDPGCCHSAGILEKGKLTEATKTRIIQNIIDIGNLGFDAVHPEMPIGKELGIPAIGGLVPLDLIDEKKYPEFHKRVLKTFEQIALALDVKGGFMIAPIVDPFAVGLKFGFDVSFKLQDLPFLTPPTLAAALNINLPDVLKIIPKLELPKIPPFEIPSLEIPKVNAPPDHLELYTFLAWPKPLLGLILKLAIPDIKFITGMLQIPPNLKPIVKLVIDAQLFGPTKPTDVTKIIIISELALFTARCATIALVSMIVGDGGANGITGQLGAQYGFRKAPSKK